MPPTARWRGPTVLRTLLRSRGPFRRLLAGVGLYGLGNFSATLLILRATQLLHDHGRTNPDAAVVAVLLYAATTQPTRSPPTAPVLSADGTAVLSAGARRRGLVAS